jgi:acyl-CoA synthetase (AMP-forming)/AMP-acid ligase II
MNVTDPLFHLAAIQPDRPALVRLGGAATSFAMLAQRIDACARRARALGLLPGQIVGLRQSWPGDDGLGLIVSLGLARAGVATADVALPARHLAAFFPRPGLQIPPGVRQLPLDPSWFDDPGTDPLPAEDHAARLFRIVGTSGSTGQPRFCPLTHATMMARLAAAGAVGGAAWQPVVLCGGLPLDGVFGQRHALSTLCGGGTLVVGDVPEDRLTEAVATLRVTVLTTSPAYLARVVARLPDGTGPLASLKSIMLSGSHVPAPLWEAARRRVCPHIFVTYGTSETAGIAVGRYEDMLGSEMTVVRLKQGVAAQAVSADHVPLPPGRQGLLRVRTPGDIAGYFDDPAATRAAFRDGWFYPGDVGSVSADGELRVLARAGDLINSGGVKINPRLIEAVIRGAPNVADVAAFPVRDRYGLEQPWAAIVLTGPVSAAQLQDHCRATLGPATPRHFLQMQRLPRNEAGKVLTRTLIDMAERRQAEAQASGSAA